MFKKKLSTIMGGFIKAKVELEQFIDQQEAEASRLLELTKQLEIERSAVNADGVRAFDSLTKIREILGE